MSTSRQPPGGDRHGLRRRALDAFGLATVLAFLPELAAARAGAVLDPHPGWVAVLILAARDGTGGLFAGSIASALAVGIGSALADAGSGSMASWNRFDSGPNLIAFAACLVVSWIASWHLRRQADFGQRLQELTDRNTAYEATVEALRDVIAALRARVDRTSTSLSFLRGAAARLDGKDPVAAAEGAVDLALARTGANAAAVRVGTGEFQRLLAVRDAKGPASFEPLSLRDAELTVPIRKGNDRVGAIALWGIPRGGLDEATAHDLEVIASWCASALVVLPARPDRTAHGTGRVP